MYDTGNQLTSMTYSDGVTPNVSNISYDADGQRTSLTDGTGTSSWAWDSLNRMTSYTNGSGVQVQWAYNLRNLPTTITYPGGSNVTRGYDAAGRWTSVQDWNGNLFTFGYDANSNLTTETLPAASGVVDSSTFDNADRLTGITVNKVAVPLFTANYSRDPANQLTSDTSASAGSNFYKYNSLNQLCYAGAANATACATPPPGGVAYNYDAGDNLTQTGSTQQVFNAADQLCWTAPTAGSCSTPPSGATTYRYDAKSNRTAATPAPGQAQTLTYDQANRLTRYAASGTTTYAYNADGLRVSKTAGSTTQFVWDLAGSLPLLLKDGTTAYIHGPGGLPLEQVNGTTVYYFHHDQLGSTRLLTDSTGVSQATYTYDPYGNLVASTGTITNPLLFSGQYRDTESGFYYLRARYYDPGTGQFISIDPLVQTTRQPHAYAAGNPLNVTDLTGLQGSARGHTPPPCSKLPRGCEIFGGYLRQFGEWVKEQGVDGALSAVQGCQAAMDLMEGVVLPPQYQAAQKVGQVGMCIAGAIGGQFGVDWGTRIHDKPPKPGVKKRSLLPDWVMVPAPLMVEFGCGPMSAMLT